MPLNVMTCQINFALKKRNKYKIIFPFEIVFQTTSKHIEQYCLENYPQLMSEGQYNMDLLAKLQYMKAYIKRSLTMSDKNEIMGHFQFRQWFAPVDSYTKIVVGDIEVYDCNCKIWTSKIPYLTVYGRFTVDLEKIVDYYIERKYFRFLKGAFSLTKYIADMVFDKPLPFVLIYDGAMNYNGEILEILKIHFNKPSVLLTALEKTLKVKELVKLKKELGWSGTNVRITISDWKKLMKGGKLPLAIGVGAFLIDKEKKRQQEIELIQQELDVYKVLLNELENMKKR